MVKDIIMRDRMIICSKNDSFLAIILEIELKKVYCKVNFNKYVSYIYNIGHSNLLPVSFKQW